MASKQATVDYIADQIEHAGVITSRKMFGEYALYYDTKVVAFICDDKLFIKPTVAGRKIIGDVTEAPAYPGSKMYFLIDGDLWEDREWMTELIKQTADELPLPKPKKK
ncbi:MAG: TfoX/Sxy family protein [Candidatus Levyibacteriota bacterium]